MVPASESFLDTRGRAVCRRCYYAEQVKAQGERAAKTEGQLGFLELVVAGKRLFVGGPLFLLGGVACHSLLRSGECKMAGWAGLIAALGAVVIALALRDALRGR
jgi:hypothetical protein